MILAALALLHVSPFQAALDAAPPGATIIASDYKPVVKFDVLITKPVTIIGGIFAASDYSYRPRLPISGAWDPEEPALRIYDQDLDGLTDQVRFVGSAIFGPVKVRFDRLVIDDSLVFGAVRAYPGTLTVHVTNSLVRAGSDHRAPAGISAEGVAVLLDKSLVKGGSSKECAAGGAGVVCRVLGTINGARTRGGPGTCGMPRGPEVVLR